MYHGFSNKEILAPQGTLGMKSERIIRTLLEMMDLDSSDYVRLMVCAVDYCKFINICMGFIW